MFVRSFKRLLSVSLVVWLNDDTIEMMEIILFLSHIGVMLKMQINEVIHLTWLHSCWLWIKSLMFVFRQIKKEIEQWQQEIITMSKIYLFFFIIIICYKFKSICSCTLFFFSKEKTGMRSCICVFWRTRKPSPRESFRWYLKREGESLIIYEKNVMSKLKLVNKQ